MPPQFHGKQPPPPPQPQPQGGTYEQDQMRLQNTFSDRFRSQIDRARHSRPLGQDIPSLYERFVSRFKKPNPPQPTPPQIDITQEDGFGGIWNQPKPPPPPPPPPQPWRPKWTSGHTYVKDPLSVLPPSRGGTGPPTGWGLKQRSGTQYVKGVGRAPQQSGGISGQQQGIGQQQQTPTQGGPGGY